MFGLQIFRLHLRVRGQTANRISSSVCSAFHKLRIDPEQTLSDRSPQVSQVTASLSHGDHFGGLEFLRSVALV